ncbi:MAG: hypothetical protein OXG72_13730 [Acidobacteria bacterium]|nr:hypothetical protein [Acidobacteriota bacterium]
MTHLLAKAFTRMARLSDQEQIGIGTVGCVRIGRARRVVDLRLWREAAPRVAERAKVTA